MDKWLQILLNVKWNYLSIPRLQQWNRWSFEMDKQFHPAILGKWLFLHDVIKVKPFEQKRPLD